MKRFIFVITMALGWTSFSFSNPVLTQKAAPQIQSLATETVTGNKVTGFCDPKETAKALLWSNVGIASGGLAAATLFGFFGKNFWGPFLLTGAFTTLANHIVQLGISGAYYDNCKDNTAIQ